MITSARCPWWLYLWIGLLVSGEAINIWGTVNFASTYANLNIPFSPVTRLLFSALWVIVFCGLFIGLWQRRVWAFACAAPIFTAYSLYGLAWQVLFARADYDRGRIGFSAITTVILLLPVWWISLRRHWLPFAQRHSV